MDGFIGGVVVGAVEHPVVEAVDSEENGWPLNLWVDDFAPEGTPSVEGKGRVIGTKSTELLQGDVTS